MIGKLIRPSKPDADKLTIYECGEPTIGSAWIQFDLRFYVVALLFVIFDVEVAFFFPWAVVFGNANTLANPDLPKEQRTELSYELAPGYKARRNQLIQANKTLDRTNPPNAADIRRRNEAEIKRIDDNISHNAEPAHQLAWFAFWDILIFFGVLLVGFAYLWRRGDLDWVRSTAAERMASTPPPAAIAPKSEKAEELVGAGPTH
jgi:NADH-quinone oxidoreductase subunit A